MLCFPINIFSISISILIVVLFSIKILKILGSFEGLKIPPGGSGTYAEIIEDSDKESFHSSTCPIVLTKKSNAFFALLRISSYFQSERYVLPPWSVPVTVAA